MAKKGSLFKLFIPIYFETLLLMASGIVDTLMLSSVPNGVGAAGTANTYIGMFFILLNVISCGMMAVITQNIGAGKPGVAYQTRQIALILNAIVGLLVAVFLAALAKPVLTWLNTSPALLPAAARYMRIVAVGYFFDAITTILCAYLRAFKHYRQPFAAIISGNLLNIGLNALFLFGFGWGIEGVAGATVVGKLFALVLVFVLGHFAMKRTELKERESRRVILGQILKIGFPAAMESISYSVAMAIAMAFVNEMDPAGFNATAKSYTTQISNFSYCAAFALAQANCYFVGWRIGGNEMEKCYKGTLKVGLIGIGLGVTIQLVFASLGRVLAGIFTTDEALMQVIQCALFIDIGLEVGRATNLILGQALKTSGYSLIPSIVSAVINAIVAVAGTYIFGIVCGWGVLGCVFALTLDECCRGLFLFFMWRSRRWEKAAIIKRETATT